MPREGHSSWNRTRAAVTLQARPNRAGLTSAKARARSEDVSGSDDTL